MSEYRKSLALGGSDIRNMVADFERWWFERQLVEAGTLPEWMQRDPSPAAEFGTLVHRALLEPWKHVDDVIMPYVKSFALKEGKQTKAEAETLAEYRGSIVIRHEHNWALDHIKSNFEQMMTANGMTPPCSDTVEVEVFGNVDGISLKGKLDWLHTDALSCTLIDLKTISDWSKRVDVLFSANYHCQLAHYADLCIQKPNDHAIVWIESVPPYRVELEQISRSVIDLGLVARNKAIKLYADRKHPKPKGGPF